MNPVKATVSIDGPGWHCTIEVSTPEDCRFLDQQIKRVKQMVAVLVEAEKYEEMAARLPHQNST